MAVKKLRPYFQAHTIVLLTGLPIKAILHKPDVSGRLLKWAVDLREFDIEYQPRTTIKGQALADLVVESSDTHSQGVGIEKWVLETDGSSRAQGGGAGIVLRTLDGSTMQVHQGLCETHIGGRTLGHRIVTRDYYWPTVKQESEAFMRKCDVCQRFANVIHVPAKTLHSMTSPWPLYKWGIDVVGPLLVAIGQRKFMLVATDYFTKWGSRGLCVD